MGVVGSLTCAREVNEYRFTGQEYGGWRDAIHLQDDDTFNKKRDLRKVDSDERYEIALIRSRYLYSVSVLLLLKKQCVLEEVESAI